MLAYAAGIVVGNLGLFPLLSPEVHNLLTIDSSQVTQQADPSPREDIWSEQQLVAYSIYKMQDTLMSISILLALPLLLFSTDLRAFLKSAQTIIVSLIIAVVAVCTMVVLGFFLVRNVYGDESWKIGGLLVGVYTGGTPNMASLKMMLDVEPATYILLHSYDLIISFVYLVFLLSIGSKFFRWILPDSSKLTKTNKDVLDESTEKVNKIPFKNKLISIGKGLLVALGIVGVSALVALQVPASALMVTIILMITTLSLLASLISAIRNLDLTFDVGMYLILIFSIVVASMVDIHSLKGITPGIFMYLVLVVFGSLAIQVVLSRLVKIDADTVMVTSVAFICSPPFVPVVAGALKNRKIIMPGITIGVIGYAIGNYLGFLMAQLLQSF